MADVVLGGGVIEISTTGVKEAKAAIQGVEVSLKSAGAAARQAGQQIQSAGGQGAMGLMMLSQTIDDVQYGFRAIVNNIPMMASALGQAFGLSSQAAMKFGGIAGIAAVAINVIIQHWDQLFERFGYGTDTMRQTWKEIFGDVKDVAVSEIDTIAERIKQLEAKPIKLATDTFELDQAKKKLEELKDAQKAWEQMSKGRSAFEKESGGKIQSLFEGMDRQDLEKVRTGMVQARAGRMNANSNEIENEFLTDAEKQSIRTQSRERVNAKTGQITYDPANEAKEAAAIEALQEERSKEAARVRIANEKKAALELGDIYNKAISGTDDNARKQLAKALLDAKRPELAARVEAAAPAKLAPGFATIEEQMQQEAFEAHGRANTREFLKKQAVKEAKDREEQEAIEVQGRRNIKAYEKQQRDRQDRENSRLADTMAGGAVGRSLLANERMSQEDLETRVRGGLSKSGMKKEDIESVTADVAKKLREKVDKEVESRSLTKVIGKDEARAQLSTEAEERSLKEEERDMPKSQVMSTEQYLNQLLTASLNKPDKDVPKDHLKATEEGNKILEDIVVVLEEQNKNNGPAVFARARA